ncbi:MAG: helix-turn-helix transcriptional regulator [Succinivibrio sp.]|nr:helix-turn-helix transcriptional regulator [Succinivibrio sp.]
MAQSLTFEEFLVRLKADTLTTAQGACPAAPILKIFQGKWRDEILYCLCIYDSIRFGELKKLLPGITNTMLSAALRELEQEGLVSRRQFNEIPPHVEYSFTEKGRDLLPVFYEMARWGLKWADQSRSPAPQSGS